MNKSRCFGSFTEIDAKLLTFVFFNAHIISPEKSKKTVAKLQLSFWRREKRKLNGYPSPHHNHASGVYIINFARNCISSTQSVVYHQAAGRYTLTRDEIQGRSSPLMIYRLASDDIPSLRLG